MVMECSYVTAFESKNADFVSKVVTKGRIFHPSFHSRARTPYDYMAITHALSYTSSCSSLYITLSGCGVGDKEIERLVEPLSSAKKNLQVIRLDLSKNSFTSKGILHLFRGASSALSSLQTKNFKSIWQPSWSLWCAGTGECCASRYLPQIDEAVLGQHLD